ncbi:MAG: tRNA (adenosine(37)-N6)-threonylcarbamoyltransferase complex ATPase subunit type 1 TsaE [Alphaproteobacteria bacterium PRO2]|nr:tRNA (adenosine(37)-N6)-threonylcarbamoyltransferase complex ATPase subunit type 1 TsaE [Alphaproteobacteria bacterium PRO2]
MKLPAAIETHSEEETARIAAGLAPLLRPGDGVLLRGPLGGGKSVFARALIRALTGEPGLEVPSPTFTLVQPYDTPKGPLSHFDLYRLKSSGEIFELGWDDALLGIMLVEWPERIDSGLLPPRGLDILFAPVKNKPNSRSIQVTERK